MAHKCILDLINRKVKFLPHEKEMLTSLYTNMVVTFFKKEFDLPETEISRIKNEIENHSFDPMDHVNSHYSGHPNYSEIKREITQINKHLIETLEVLADKKKYKILSKILSENGYVVS